MTKESDHAENVARAIERARAARANPVTRRLAERLWLRVLTAYYPGLDVRDLWAVVEYNDEASFRYEPFAVGEARSCVDTAAMLTDELAAHITEGLDEAAKKRPARVPAIREALIALGLPAPELARCPIIAHRKNPGSHWSDCSCRGTGYVLPSPEQEQSGE